MLLQCLATLRRCQIEQQHVVAVEVLSLSLYLPGELKEEPLMKTFDPGCRGGYRGVCSFRITLHTMTLMWVSLVPGGTASVVLLGNDRLYMHDFSDLLPHPRITVYPSEFELVARCPLFQLLMHPSHSAVTYFQPWFRHCSFSLQNTYLTEKHIGLSILAS